MLLGSENNKFLLTENHIFLKDSQKYDLSIKTNKTVELFYFILYFLY